VLDPAIALIEEIWVGIGGIDEAVLAFPIVLVLEAFVVPGRGIDLPPWRGAALVRGARTSRISGLASGITEKLVKQAAPANDPALRSYPSRWFGGLMGPR
jgi:hypothetical protein